MRAVARAGIAPAMDFDTDARDGSRHPSPPLALLAAAHAALFLASIVVTGILTRGEHLPSPFAPGGAALEFFSRHTAAVRWNAFLQLGAAVPLGLFAATAASRLHYLGARAAGVAIAFFGGAGAAVLLALSATFQWALASSDVLVSPPTVRALHLLVFATGGPAHVELLGLLVAGVAVTGGIRRLLPTWMMAPGLAIAVVAELSWLTLVLPAASVLLPVARFPALAWLVVAGALLPRSRRATRELLPRMATRRVAPAGRPAADTP
jgi:hypothetical protein